MLSGIADNGEEDGTDEHLGNAVLIRNVINGRHKIVSIERGDDRNNEQSNDRGLGRHLDFLLLFFDLLMFRSFIQECMRAELEDQVANVDSEQNHSRTARDKEDAVHSIETDVWSRHRLLLRPGKESAENRVVAAAALDGTPVRSRQNHGEAAKCHDRAGCLGGCLSELVFRLVDATNEEAETEHKE